MKRFADNYYAFIDDWLDLLDNVGMCGKLVQYKDVTHVAKLHVDVDVMNGELLKALYGDIS